MYLHTNTRRSRDPVQVPSVYPHFSRRIQFSDLISAACAGALQGGIPGGLSRKIFSKNEAESCILTEKRGVLGTQEPIRGTRLLQRAILSSGVSVLVTLQHPQPERELY